LISKRCSDCCKRFFIFSRKSVIVGVHIRRGDYKEWLDGIYYFSDEAYSRAMKDLEKQLLEKGEKVKFLICSNEKINLNSFSELDCFIIPESSSEKDLYALSKSDYIIGPPSSFSQWASFLWRSTGVLYDV
jgi:Glycosyl transferase family 11.